MTPFRQALALHAVRASRQIVPRHVLSSRVPTRFARASPYSTTPVRLQNTFHSQLDNVSDFPFVTEPVVENPQTLTEKIVQRHAVGLAPGKKVKAGDYVTLRPHHTMSHDNSWPIASKFMSIGASKVHNNRQPVMTLDHDIQNTSEQNLKKYRQIEEFAKTHGIDFYPAGHGIGHQVMIEEGYAWPGTLTVASDSHSNMYGGVGCLGTPVVRTDAASILATSKTWWQCPPVAKITLGGVMPPGVTGKDVIVALCGLFNKDEVLNHALEFVGSEETMRLFPVDSVLEAWLRARATTAAMMGPDNPTSTRFNHQRIDKLVDDQLYADPGATYAKSFYINLSTLSPFVSGPNSVKVATPLKDLEAQDIKIQKAYLVSCTNSRSSDIAAAARVVREATDKGLSAKFAPGVSFYLAAASLKEQAAEEAGDWQVLIDAGAKVLPASCGPCIGLGTGLLEPGENGISASNRNFKGRMGSTEAKAYLASPEVVTASALQGKIAGPGWYERPEGVEKVIIGEGSGDHVADQALSIEEALEKIIAQADGMIAEGERDVSDGTAEPAAAAVPEEESLTEILPGFPEKIEGEIVFCDSDNVNTDGIYPGKYTYQDDVTTEKMAEVCMENYDADFRNIAKAGDILVSGFNFGTGSSREQAATSILAKKIPLVVAGSFGNIFSRNSINNALLGVEVPKLVQRLRETFKDKTLTRRTGWTLKWDVRRSKVSVTEKGGETWSVKVGEMPPNVQSIIALGGLEKWVKNEIGK
ncbi:hypothetical protein ACHAQA_005172 [Verticillium albo-atrum]